MYLVCGLVDDKKEHDAGAYNARLAEKGYTIEIESADGSVTRIDSRKIAGKDNVVLAGRLDGRDLPDDLYPLRLVGAGLTEDEMPGGIVRIVVRVR